MPRRRALRCRSGERRWKARVHSTEEGGKHAIQRSRGDEKEASVREKIRPSRAELHAHGESSVREKRSVGTGSHGKRGNGDLGRFSPSIC